MGLMNKIKDILFETEEVEEKDKKSNKKHKRENEEVFESFEREEKPIVFESIKEDPPKKEVVVEQKKEVEFKTETKFTFPDFDESEFDQSLPKRTAPVVVDNYKTREIKDFKPESRLNKVTKSITSDNKKFKPSPVISPVYGILDKNYIPDDIQEMKTSSTTKTRLNVDMVRKKAFGKLDEIEKTNINLSIPNDNTEDLKEKIKTIDELLMDSADDEIEIEDYAKTKRINTNDIEAELDDDNEELDIDVNSYLRKENNKKDEEKEEDTLENDLFDLIDSMYENRKSGE